MKAIFALGIVTVLLGACKTTSQDSSLREATTQTPAEALAAQLETIACVKRARPEMIFTTGGQAPAGNGQTGNALVTVRSDTSAAACAEDIKAALPGVVILKVLANVRIITVAPAAQGQQTAAEALAARIEREVSCAESARPELILSTSGQAPAGNGQTGSVLVNVRDDADPRECAAQLQSALPDVKVDRILDTVGILVVKNAD